MIANEEHDRACAHLFDPARVEEALQIIRAAQAQVELEGATAEPAIPTVETGVTASGAKAERSSYFKVNVSGFFSLADEVVDPNGAIIGARNISVARTLLDVLKHVTGKDIDEEGDDMPLAEEASLTEAQLKSVDDSEPEDTITYRVTYLDNDAAESNKDVSVYDSPVDVIFNNPHGVIIALRNYIEDGARVLSIEEKRLRPLANRDGKLSHRRLRLCGLMAQDLISMTGYQE